MPYPIDIKFKSYFRHVNQKLKNTNLKNCNFVVQLINFSFSITALSNIIGSQHNLMCR